MRAANTLGRVHPGVLLCLQVYVYDTIFNINVDTEPQFMINHYICTVKCMFSYTVLL